MNLEGKVLECHVVYNATNNSANCGENGELKFFTDTCGVQHQRWSSQSVKYDMRTHLVENKDIKCGEKIEAEDVGKRVDMFFAENNCNDKKKIEAVKTFMLLGKNKNDIIFYNNNDIEAILKCVKDNNFEFDIKKGEAILYPDFHSFDVALFGRMFASNPELDVEGAMSVSQYVALNALKREYDFWAHFSDNKKSFGNAGNCEFASSLMYGYWKICFNTLIKNCDMNDIEKFFKDIKNIIDFINAHPRGKSHSFMYDTLPIYYCLGITDGEGLTVDYDKIKGKNSDEIGNVIYDYILKERVNNVNKQENLVLCQKGENIQEFFNKNLF